MNNNYVESLSPTKKRYTDDNGMIHNPKGDVYIFDDEGTLIKTSASPPPYPPPPPPPSPLKRMKHPSLEELKKLKECIENDPDKSYLKQFNQAVVLAENAAFATPSDLTALRWCWTVLAWRPSKSSNSKVLKKHPDNPYMK